MKNLRFLSIFALIHATNLVAQNAENLTSSTSKESIFVRGGKDLLATQIIVGEGLVAAAAIKSIALYLTAPLLSSDQATTSKSSATTNEAQTSSDAHQTLVLEASTASNPIMQASSNPSSTSSSHSSTELTSDTETNTATNSNSSNDEHFSLQKYDRIYGAGIGAASATIATTTISSSPISVMKTHHSDIKNFLDTTTNTMNLKKHIGETGENLIYFAAPTLGCNALIHGAGFVFGIPTNTNTANAICMSLVGAYILGLEQAEKKAHEVEKENSIRALADFSTQESPENNQN